LRFTYESLSLRVLFGTGLAEAHVTQALAELGTTRPLVLATERESRRALALLSASHVEPAAVFTAVRQHVPAQTAAAVRRAAAASGADGILSVGGGSTTGTAKAAALKSGLPIVAVPTTYAGSEVTPMWGITADKRKETGTDVRALPRYVVYDPDLLEGLPISMAVPSALNALAHCVEAFWTQRSNPVAVAVASEGVFAIVEGLRSLSSHAHPVAREQLLNGSFLAGLSFASAGSGLHHKICHALGGRFDLPHAPLHAVVLPHVLAFNAEAVPLAESRISAALGSRTAVEGLRDLYSAIDAPRALRDIGLRHDQIDDAIAEVTTMLPIVNPRDVTPGDVATLIRSAYDPSSGAHGA
jgi:alcohol dehydrogenase class IV